jgi:glutathione S-transferase
VLRYRHFLHYAEGSMMAPLFGLLIVNRLGLLGKPARAPIQKMLDGHLDWLESELADRDWFAGDAFSAADVMMSFPLEASRSRGGLDETRPNLIDWLERIHARPAYGEALAKGGLYAYA